MLMPIISQETTNDEKEFFVRSLPSSQAALLWSQFVASVSLVTYSKTSLEHIQNLDLWNICKQNIIGQTPPSNPSLGNLSLLQLTEYHETYYLQKFVTIFFQHSTSFIVSACIPPTNAHCAITSKPQNI